MVISTTNHAIATFLCYVAQSGSGFPSAAGVRKDPSPATSACRAQKCSREEGCSEPATSWSNPSAITWVGASFGSLGTGTSTNTGEQGAPHHYMHLQHGEPTYVCRLTSAPFFPQFYAKQGSPHTGSPMLRSPHAESLHPANPEHPAAQPCPSSPALRQPCLFAQGICSRGHLL